MILEDEFKSRLANDGGGGGGGGGGVGVGGWEGVCLCVCVWLQLMKDLFFYGGEGRMSEGGVTINEGFTLFFFK